jgi:hypothetical protein
MKLSTFQRAGLAAGLALCASGVLLGGLSLVVPADPTADCAILQPNEQRWCVGRGDDGHLVMLFPRSGPCSTCGAPAEVWIEEPDGTLWYVPSTEPGTVADLGLRYCPPAKSCKVHYKNPLTTAEIT